MARTEDYNKWSEEIISKIVEKFGRNIDEVQYKISGQSDFVMSSMYYINVKFKNKTKDQSEEYSIILKRSVQEEVFSEVTRNDCQFHNEILFYRMYAQPGENFARCFYINEQPPNNSVIALENTNERGYYPYPRKYNAPLEYTLAAMCEMGRFHGKGYVMKQLQQEKFFGIVKQLQETKYDETMDHERKAFFNITSTRAVEYLRNHDYDVTFCDKMQALLSNAFDEIMIKTLKPREPLSTLCHGDFTLANTLFKTENGEHHAMLIDFGVLNYATPVVDLSTYLCLCCSNKIRRDKFFEIIRAYHDALKEYLLEADIWDNEKYSYDTLLEDYRRGALFGFVIASFYLPILIKSQGPTNDMKILGFGKTGLIEGAKRNKQFGGDEMSQELAELLLHLKDLGCLKYYL
ncbi:uncharacterized protein LOC105829738 [Monomorium pharaonis]|uniref:uncharacterized protein LOC105829738 n=1 Tax=Monomorium pharaonis TaxID=307658 RepID=UPI00063FC263|nr:uncharacterized protein LOC105829738 [Monomorium pharaonis]